MRSRPTALLCVLRVGLLAACGSGSSSKGATTTAVTARGWSPAGVATIAQVRARLSTAFPGSCRDYLLYDYKGYVTDDNAVLKTPVPAAVASCTVSKESLEISAFPTPAARDQFVALRTSRLCVRARSRHIKVGLPWISLGSVSLQSDTEPGGRAIAAAVGARFHFSTC